MKSDMGAKSKTDATIMCVVTQCGKDGRRKGDADIYRRSKQKEGTRRIAITRACTSRAQQGQIIRRPAAVHSERGYGGGALG